MLVAKSPDIIKEACGKFFGKVDVLKRRGYTVLRAWKIDDVERRIAHAGVEMRTCL